MVITTMFNRKGGVGKSLLNQTLALHLATQENKKVLLIDLDSQANLTSRIYKYEHDMKTLGDALISNELRLKDIIIKNPVLDYKNLDLIASNENLKYLEEYLANEEDSETIILEWLSESDNIKVANEYDFIIFDLSPSFALVNRNALITCSNIILINDCETKESISSINTFINEYEEHCEDLDIDLCDFAIVNNKFRSSKVDKTTMKALEEIDKYSNLHKYFLNTNINYSSVLRNACTEKMSITDYTKKIFGSKKALTQFNDLIEEMKARGVL